MTREKKHQNNKLGFHNKGTAWFNSRIRWKIINILLSGSKKLNIAVVGFPKCATTSIQVNLSRVDDVDMPSYEIQMRDLLKRTVHFKGGRNLSGIKNPNFIYESHNLRGLIKANPNIKLIIGLRKPTNWLYSFYQYRKLEIKQRETWTSNTVSRYPHLADITFDDIVYNGKELLGASVEKGEFINFLKPVLDWIDPERVLIYFLEEIAQDPVKTYERIFRFAELEPVDFEGMLQANRKKKHYEDKNEYEKQLDYLDKYYSAKNKELNRFLKEKLNTENLYW